MIRAVKLSKRAECDLRHLPKQVIRKLQLWVRLVEESGLTEVRKIPGFHDEPLQGKRFGQRSIRLNHAYRAFYVVKRDGEIEFVSVEEVNKHEY